MHVMVDSCVLLDIFTQDANWYAWSSDQLARAANHGTVVINPVIYAEVSAGFHRIEDLDAFLAPDVFEYRPIPREAAFLAARSFMAYRKRGGVKTAPLPDFFIGAHASVEGLDLITRDTRRFASCYPRLRLICP